MLRREKDDVTCDTTEKLLVTYHKVYMIDSEYLCIGFKLYILEYVG